MCEWVFGEQSGTMIEVGTVKSVGRVSFRRVELGASSLSALSKQ